MGDYPHQFVSEGDSDDSFLFKDQSKITLPKETLIMVEADPPKADDGTKNKEDRVCKDNREALPKRRHFPRLPTSVLNSKRSSGHLYCTNVLRNRDNERDFEYASIIERECICVCCENNNNTAQAVEVTQTSRGKYIDGDDWNNNKTKNRQEAASAIALSDSSTAEYLNHSFGLDTARPIVCRSPLRQREILEKQHLFRDDSTIKDTPSSCKHSSSGERDFLRSGRENDVGMGVGGEKLPSNNSGIPDEVSVPTISCIMSFSDDRKEEYKSTEEDTIVPAGQQKAYDTNQCEIIDLIGSDASSYSGSDNSFLDEGVAQNTVPKTAKTVQPSILSEVIPKNSETWKRIYSSSDSSLESSPLPKQKRSLSRRQNKSTNNQRWVIRESSSDDEDWGEVKRTSNRNGKGPDENLLNYRNRFTFQGKTKQNKSKSNTKKINHRKGYMTDDSFVVSDDSSLDALRSINDEETSSQRGSDVNEDEAPVRRKNEKLKPISRRKPSSSKIFMQRIPPKVHFEGNSRDFKLNRETLAQCLFKEYDRKAFDGKLKKVDLVWSNKLQTTAGVTRLISKTWCDKVEREAKIELATKIVDNLERLRSTLLHEMCHAAQWLVDGVAKPPHGKCFKTWSKIAMSRVPGVVVTTMHTYEICYKYAWACTTDGCKTIIKRQSKSVDINRQCCGKCKGTLVEIEVPKSKGIEGIGGGKMGLTPKKKRTASAYNLFVKANSKAIRERLEVERKKQGLKVTQAEVLKECGRLWKQQKTPNRNLQEVSCEKNTDK